MATSRLPPGAWLSGFIPSAGFNPPVGPRSGSNPPVGPRAGSNPPVGPHGGANPPVVSRANNPPVGPRRFMVMRGDAGGPQFVEVADSFGSEWVATANGPMPTEPPIPWSGLDPEWVWAGGMETVRAQAIRKVRDRLVPPVDPRRPKSNNDVDLGPVVGAALWRWDEPFRVSAAVAELLGRLVMDGAALWWMPRPPSLSTTLSIAAAAPQLMFTLEMKAASHGTKFDYSDQIDKVLRAAVEREDRLPEILSQAEDIGVFFDAITGIDRSTAPRLRELLDVAWQVSTHLVMVLKNHMAEWRPYQRSGRVQPVIPTPGHGALPSGHATMAVLAAELLSTLLYASQHPRRDALDRLARRIAFNRVVAGVHFPMDSYAGAELARQLARILTSAGLGEALPQGTTCVIDSGAELAEHFPSPSPSPPGSTPTENQKQAGAPAGDASETKAGMAAKSDPASAGATVWQQMWQAAVEEVRARRI